MTEAGGQWTRPSIIIGILSLLASSGWAAYGISAKTKDDVETRLRTVEITLSSVSSSLNSLTASMADLNARIRDEERRR